MGEKRSSGPNFYAKEVMDGVNALREMIGRNERGSTHGETMRMLDDMERVLLKGAGSFIERDERKLVIDKFATLYPRMFTDRNIYNPNAPGVAPFFKNYYRDVVRLLGRIVTLPERYRNINTTAMAYLFQKACDALLEIGPIMDDYSHGGYECSSILRAYTSPEFETLIDNNLKDDSHAGARAVVCGIFDAVEKARKSSEKKQVSGFDGIRMARKLLNLGPSLLAMLSEVSYQVETDMYDRQALLRTTQQEKGDAEKGTAGNATDKPTVNA